MSNDVNVPQDILAHAEETAKQDLIMQNKSNTLRSQRKSSATIGMSNKAQNGLNKPTVLQLVLEAIGLRSEEKHREPTSKELSALIMLGFMFILFVISATGFCVMWFTEYYNYKMLERLVLAPNTERTDKWINPEPKYDTLLKAHIFNYTNINEYLSGRANKIIVKDIGPLTYQEHTVKKNVVFNDNYTVTFRDHKSYKFLPEKSAYGEGDIVMVPNVPLLAAAIHIEQMPFFKKGFAEMAVNALREPAFKLLKASEILWGYRDNIMALDWSGGKKDFGLLMTRNGTSVDSLQLNTGEDDIHKYSMITQFNGMPTLNFWEGDECNRIDGADPSMFSPFMLEQRNTLEVFLQVLCRKVPLHFEREVTIYKDIDALRYRTPLNVFADPTENPANACYCRNTKRCFPSGVINATKCYGDAPIYPSFPHFFSGDPKIYKNFEGIKPDAELHQTFADIHPRFAFPIGGASRVQINLAIHKTSLLRNQVNRLEEGMILPLIWIEITSDDFSQDMVDTLYISTVGLNAIQLALKYGTLLISVTTFSLIVAGIYYLKRKQEELTEMQRTITEVVALQQGVPEME